MTNCVNFQTYLKPQQIINLIVLVMN
jgi:hypothetical protein